MKSWVIRLQQLDVQVRIPVVRHHRHALALPGMRRVGACDRPSLSESRRAPGWERGMSWLSRPARRTIPASLRFAAKLARMEDAS